MFLATSYESKEVLVKMNIWWSRPVGLSVIVALKPSGLFPKFSKMRVDPVGPLAYRVDPVKPVA